VGRVAVDFGVGQGAKRSEPDWHIHSDLDQASNPESFQAKIHGTLEGARQKGSWLGRSLVTAR